MSLLRKWPLLLAWIAVLSLAGQSALAQEGGIEPSLQPVTIHVVQAGETLSSIASLYGTTVEVLQEANGLEGAEDVEVGRRLVISRRVTAPEVWAGQPITVGLGDTLDVLAVRYGVSREQLGLVNKVVNPDSLYAGQTLYIPDSIGPLAEDMSSVIRLSEGDSLLRLALRTNSNVVALMVYNKIANASMVMPGTVLLVPDEGASQSFLLVPWKRITMHPLPLEQGHSGGLQVITSEAGTLQAIFLGKELNIISADGVLHQAVLGIDRWTAPGLYPLSLIFQDGNGRTWTYTRLVSVERGGYPSQTETIRLSAEDMALLSDPLAIQQESLYVQQNMTGFSPERYWDGVFLLPTAGVLTSGFGTARNYNMAGFGNFHTGADLAARVGTLIYAPADGVVVDTGLLDVRGYITIIDHGWGVYTGYWHQASILVNPGDVVTAGQQIGTVGNTGLSTASHLHWEMWVGGVQVDPLQWVREAFP
jgi:murein DD-endopeptidase MepM/ murein hydrolase activator NlpD